MTDCCASTLDAKFDTRSAEQQVRQFRRDGPPKQTRLLLEALRAAGLDDASVLDIGGGIGAVQLGLLSAGARRVLSVEVSRGSIEAARALASEHGYLDRIEYHCGDFVDLAPDIASADVVTLDKVICCYPDMDALVGQSADRARRLYGAVYPRYTLPVRSMIHVQNAFRRLARSDFRSWVHPTTAIEAMLTRRGFRLRSAATTLVWKIVVFERHAGS